MPNATQTKNLNIRITPKLLRDIKSAAKQDERDMSDWIRCVLEEWLYEE